MALEENKELSALFTLIDDPDEEVFGLVSEKIIDYGKPVIPNLEHLWENTPDSTTQERIEILIHRLHFRDLREDIRQWNVSGHHDLLLGSLLVSKFQFPELTTAPVLLEIEKVRRNIWLELNNYLTPLEQIRIVTSILYSYYGLKGSEINYLEPTEFMIHKTLEAKRGNQLSNGILYLVLCELLDIPVRAVRLPKQFVLAYFKPGYSDEQVKDHREKIEFFIDPTAGQVFTHTETENYFRRLAMEPTPESFRPLSNKQVVQYLLNEISHCFKGEKEYYKYLELQELYTSLE